MYSKNLEKGRKEMKLIVISYLCLFNLLLIVLNIQAATWPLGIHDDMSSSFGPRDYGSDNYDFHRGVDIADFDRTVEAITTGTIVYISTISIIVKDDNTGHLIRYTHINVSGLMEGDRLNEGEEFTTTRDGDGHLDIKYYWYIIKYWDKYKDVYETPLELLTYIYSDGAMNYWAADHPMRLLPYTDNNTNFEANIHPNVLYDEHGPYIMCYGRVDNKQLDLNGIEIYLSALDRNGYPINHHRLLAGEYDLDNWEFDDWLEFEYRINCGDLYINDSDNGFNNWMGIDPEPFEYWHPYHTVIFKFYLDEFVLLEASKISAYIYVYDILNNEVEAENIPVYTIIGDPLPGTPEAPNLTAVQYHPSNGYIKLDWQSNGDADFFKIYRCSSTEQMTNDHCVGIASAEYYQDDDPLLVPGVTYKYAVAGINVLGEGSNSNEIECIYGQALPSQINSSRTLNNAWYANNNVSITGNSTLTISAGTKIALGHRISIIVQDDCKIISMGTENNLVKLMPIDHTKIWDKIELKGAGGNKFSYTEFKNGKYSIVVRSRDNILDHCRFINNNINSYCCLLSSINTLGVNSQFRLVNCILETKKCGILAYYADAIIQNTTIRSTNPNNGFSGLYVGTNSSVSDLRYSLITGFKYGIWISSASLKIGRCRIVECRYEEVYLASWYSRLYPYYSLGALCNIYDTNNGRYYVFSYSESLVKLKYCYWNIFDQQIIENKMYGDIEFMPYLGYPIAKNAGADWGERFKLPSPENTMNDHASAPMIADQLNRINTVNSLYDYEGEIAALIDKIEKKPFSVSTGKYLKKLYFLCKDHDPKNLLNKKDKVSNIISKIKKVYMTTFHRNNGKIDNQGLRTAGEVAILLALENMIQEKRYQNAIKTAKKWEKYINFYGSLRELLLKKIYIYERLGNYHEAILILDQLLSLDKKENIRSDHHLEFEYEMIRDRIEQLRNSDVQIRNKNNENVYDDESLNMVDKVFHLEPNYPNPFNPSTIISFNISEDSKVKIIVLNILGQQVDELTDDCYAAGRHSLTFHINNDLASGLYIVKAIINSIKDPNKSYVFTRRMLYVK